MASQRVDLKTAARMLDTSVDAVRKRVSRGTLDSERDPDGRVYVWLDLDQTMSPTDSHQEILKAKDETIEFLREQLAAWQEEARRKDHIIARLTERIPELEPAVPREPQEEPQDAGDAPEGPGRQDVSGGQEEATEHRSWWRRWFG